VVGEGGIPIGDFVERTWSEVNLAEVEAVKAIKPHGEEERRFPTTGVLAGLSSRLDIVHSVQVAFIHTT
jgi:hypothetical protein